MVDAKKLQEDATNDPYQIAITDMNRDTIRIERQGVPSLRRATAVAVVGIALALAASAPYTLFEGERENYFKRLGVSRSNSTSQVKRAFREISRKIHPDKVPATEKASAEKKFHTMQEAYDALHTDKKRFVYERHGTDGIKCFDDKSCTAREHAFWVNDTLMLCVYYCSVAVFCMFFTSLKGSSASVQMFVYGGYAVTLAMELLLRGVHEDGPPGFDLPSVGALGELTRYEKALLLRVYFILYAVTSLMVGAIFNEKEAEANLTRSYFNALLLQQQEMAELLKHQAAAIEQLKRERKSPK